MSKAWLGYREAADQSLLLSEVGVAVPKFLAGLFEYRKGTTITIHIDVGHVKIMLCCRRSNLVGSKTAHC